MVTFFVVPSSRKMLFSGQLRVRARVENRQLNSPRPQGFCYQRPAGKEAHQETHEVFLWSWPVPCMYPICALAPNFSSQEIS